MHTDYVINLSLNLDGFSYPWIAWWSGLLLLLLGTLSFLWVVVVLNRTRRSVGTIERRISLLETVLEMDTLGTLGTSDTLGTLEVPGVPGVEGRTSSNSSSTADNQGN
jgi:hypothetical protein